MEGTALATALKRLKLGTAVILLGDQISIIPRLWPIVTA